MRAPAQRLGHRVLQILLDPPVPPADFGPVRVFHPSPKFRSYSVLIWSCKQLGVLAGLFVALFVEDLVEWWELFGFLQVFMVLESRFLDMLPALIPLMLTVTGIAGYLSQLPITFLPAWLKLRTHWYIVGKDGLYLREGFRQVHELTIRFRNIQQVTLKQNPLQRWFGIADVEVQTAGGGKATTDGDSSSASKRAGHVAVFRSVDNPEQLRDMIRSQLGRQEPLQLNALGQPNDQPGTPEILQAANKLLGEAKALRQVLASMQPAD